MVVATPAGQWHHIGALMAAVAASDAGWNIFYFGPNLPAEEIAAAVKLKQARCVALSITYPGNEVSVVRELKRLKGSLHPDVRIAIGGRGSKPYQQVIADIGALRTDDLREFAASLNAVT
jgi:methanogenic corrinoid protein MtbC1